jgi:uncharacterized membrane protein YcjF (UPF0283 family)
MCNSRVEKKRETETERERERKENVDKTIITWLQKPKGLFRDSRVLSVSILDGKSINNHSSHLIADTFQRINCNRCISLLIKIKSESSL